MACDVKVSDFIGLYGQAIVWADLPHPYCYRGWHIQECILAAYKLGYAAIVLAPEVWLGVDSEHLTSIKTNIPLCNRMVLLTDKHAVASDGKKVYDPKGYVYDLSELLPFVKIICLIHEIKS